MAERMRPNSIREAPRTQAPGIRAAATAAGRRAELRFAGLAAAACRTDPAARRIDREAAFQSAAPAAVASRIGRAAVLQIVVRAVECQTVGWSAEVALPMPPDHPPAVLPTSVRAVPGA